MRIGALSARRLFVPVLALLLVASGCTPEPSETANIAAIIQRNAPPALSLNEARSRLKKEEAQARKLIERMINALNSVQDDSTASAAISELQKLKGEVQSHRGPRSATYVKCSQSEWEELSRDTQRSIEAFQEEIKPDSSRLQQMRASLERADLSIGKRMELSRAAQDVSFAAAFAQDSGYHHQPPLEHTATLATASRSGAAELGEYVRRKHSISSYSSRTSDGWSIQRFVPVTDLQSFVASIDLGTVKTVDERRRIVLVALSEDELAKLQQMKEKREEEARIAREKEQQERAEKEERDRAARVEKEVAERKQLLEECLATLQQMKDPLTVRDLADQLKGKCKRHERILDTIERVKRDYQREVGEAYQDDVDYERLYAQITGELKRIQSQPATHAMLAQRVGENLTAVRLLEHELPFGSPPDPAENPNSPLFFVANLNELTLGSHFEFAEALQRLAVANPENCQDIQTRRAIARRIRDIVVDKSSHSRDEAIRPLVVWGGKHSVPILIDLLAEGRLGGEREQVIAALALHPTPEGAAAVAKLVGNFFVHDEACQTLRKMGPVAEDALIKIAPSDEPKISIAAITMLGDCGSEKSLELLRQARSSTNPEIKFLAREATKKINERVKSKN